LLAERTTLTAGWVDPSRVLMPSFVSLGQTTQLTTFSFKSLSPRWVNAVGIHSVKRKKKGSFCMDDFEPLSTQQRGSQPITVVGTQSEGRWLNPFGSFAIEKDIFTLEYTGSQLHLDRISKSSEDIPCRAGNKKNLE
jgi:hypothetical protein